MVLSTDNTIQTQRMVNIKLSLRVLCFFFAVANVMIQV